MISVRSVTQVGYVEFNMAKIMNSRGKMSHCNTKKERDPELLKLWEKKLAKKKKLAQKQKV